MTSFDYKYQNALRQAIVFSVSFILLCEDTICITKKADKCPIPHLLHISGDGGGGGGGGWNYGHILSSLALFCLTPSCSRIEPCCTQTRLLWRATLFLWRNSLSHVVSVNPGPWQWTFLRCGHAHIHKHYGKHADHKKREWKYEWELQLQRV